MSEPFFHYAHMDDESNRSSLSFTGTELGRGYHALERTRYPAYQASHTHMASTVSHQLRGAVLPPNDWPADTPIQAHKFAIASQFRPSPGLFPFPPTLCVAPVPGHARGNPSPHSGYIASSGAGPLVSQHDRHTVTMPTRTGHAHYGGGLINARRCHYEPLFGFNDDHTGEQPRTISSPSIAMPMVPMTYSAGVSSHAGPLFPSGPALRQSSPHSTGTLQDLSPSNSALGLTPAGSIDSESYSSSSRLINHSPVVPRSEAASDQIQPQPIITASLDQLYTLTVPLEDVVFPIIASVGEIPFFRCRWGNCQSWITSDKDAVKDHLTRTHHVELKSACCEWVGCASSTRGSGLVRHLHTHLRLKWLCSVCKVPYTREDSVRCHARRKLRCQLAQPISHPSAVAYRARINGDNTVTLTKILQP